MPNSRAISRFFSPLATNSTMRRWRGLSLRLSLRIVVPFLSETKRGRAEEKNRGQESVKRDHSNLIARTKVEQLLNRAAHLREDSNRIRANRAHHTNYNDQDHCQHDRVLSHILTFCVRPKLFEQRT